MGWWPSLSCLRQLVEVKAQVLSWQWVWVLLTGVCLLIVGLMADEHHAVRAQHTPGITCRPTGPLSQKHMRDTYLSLCHGGQADGPSPAICCDSVRALGAERACVPGHRMRRCPLLSTELVRLCCPFPSSPVLPHWVCVSSRGACQCCVTSRGLLPCMPICRQSTAGAKVSPHLGWRGP